MKTLFFLTGALLIFFKSTAFTVEPDTGKERTYIVNGLKLVNEGKYDSAFIVYKLGSEIYLKSGDSIGYGKCLYGMGIALHFPGKSKEAMPYYFSSFKIISNKLPEMDPFFGFLNNSIGAAYIDQGNRFIAKKYLKKALEIDMVLYGKDSISTAVVNYNMGLIAMYFGEHQEGLNFFMNALPAYLQKYGRNGSRVAQLYTNVGLIHYDLCDYDLAKEYYDRAINIHIENHGENYWNLAYPYTSLGEMYDVLGKDDLALSYYLKALKLTDTDERDLSRLKSIINGILGKYYGEKGEFEKGLEYTQTAIDIMQENFFENHPRLSDFYRIEGNIYKKQGKFDQAKNSYDKANEIIRINYGIIHPILAKNLADQADMYLQMGNYKSALNSVEEGIKSITLQLNKGDLIDNPEINSVMDEKELLNLIILRGKINKEMSMHEGQSIKYLEDALDDFLFATSIIDHIRRELLSEGSKLFLQQNAVYVYEQAIAVCQELYNKSQNKEYIKKAFFFLEKSKGAILSEALQVADLSEIQGIPVEVLNREKEINRLIKSFELKLADSEKSENDSLQKKLTSSLFHAKISQDSLTSVIKIRYPEYFDLKYNDEVVSLEQVQKILQKSTLVTSFFEGDSVWYILTITKNDFQLNSLQKSGLSHINMNKLFRDLSNNASDINELSLLSYRVYQTFLEPILSKQNDIENLIVVPDGLLSHIPFGALVMEDPSASALRPRYLIEKYSISYANSLTLNSKITDIKRDEKYIGFAPVYSNLSSSEDNLVAYRDVLTELTGTLEEVETAGKLFKGKVYLAENATESNFKNLNNSPVILHLAMHAIIDDSRPMNSKLLFSQEADFIDDSELNAYEIYNIKIGSQLAVLSACNTGVGELNRGEGVMSLSRAFIYAGCPNIVMSLWRAKDQPTTEIMADFFQLLKKELPKDKALQMAKLNYINSSDPLKAHPANWATFVLLGNSEPLKLDSNGKRYWISAAILIFLLGIYYLLRRNVKQSGS